MTLFGVGVQGGVSSGGTTLGRIGYGYVYPQFNAQMRYTTPDLGGVKVAVGIFDPSQIGTGCSTSAPDNCFAQHQDPARRNGALLRDDTGRAEGPGLDQRDVPARGLFGNAPGRLPGRSQLVGRRRRPAMDVRRFDVLASGYYGKALGTTLMLDTDSLDTTGNGAPITGSSYRVPRWAQPSSA